MTLAVEVNLEHHLIRMRFPTPSYTLVNNSSISWYIFPSFSCNKPCVSAYTGSSWVWNCNPCPYIINSLENHLCWCAGSLPPRPPFLPPSRMTGTSAAGQSYRWQSLAWQTMSSQWPLETVHELKDQRPEGGGEQRLKKQTNKNYPMIKRKGTGATFGKEKSWRKH